MKADLSRSTFDPARHVKRVPLQQGRVQTDADANEQLDVVFYRAETEAADLIGGCGGPIDGAGFGLSIAGADLMIGAGRYYAGGTLVENEAEVAYDAQPYYPLDAATRDALDPDDTLGLDALAEPPDGECLAYLDVWEWHRTALEEPPIREVALGGPDTATRTRVLGQVKLHALEAGETADCVGPIASWEDVIAPSTGQLSARTDVAAASTDPCIVTPGAGYRRLENQLYRVEVHDGGTLADATFKWDRDNGTIVARLDAQSPTFDEWTLSSVGRDAVLRFAPGDWAELIDDARELHGLPGTLVQVDSVAGDVLTVDLTTATGPIDGAAFLENARVRRWNGVFDGDNDASFRDLEDGVQVRVRGGGRRYRTGDYWTIPARTNTGDVEWPTEDGGWVVAEGIGHHYCRLGLVTVADGWDAVTDCRSLFPPVTELTGLFYVGGDGQEGAPLEPLAHRLQVGVANGLHPVEGARVRVSVVDGGGQLDGSAAVEVATDADGLASVAWTLGAGGPQRAEAELLDAAGDPLHLPVRFAAEIENLTLDYVGGDGQHGVQGETLPYPLQVGVSRGDTPVAGETVRFRIVAGGGTVDGQPAVEVATLVDGTATVRWTLGGGDDQRVEAALLDGDGNEAHLPVRFSAQVGGPGETDPGFHVERVLWQNGFILRNDARAGLDDLRSGLLVAFDAPLAKEAVRGGPSEQAPDAMTFAKPVCTLTLHLPYPLDASERNLWNFPDRLSPGFGTRPIRLDGTLVAEEDRLLWNPSDPVLEWLEKNPFSVLLPRVADRLLGSLRLAGDKLWAADTERPVYLDGEAFGRPRASDGGTDVVLPSGDGRRGSDFELWFWLVETREDGRPSIAVSPAALRFPEVSAPGQRLERTLRIRNDGGAPLQITSLDVGPGVFRVEAPLPLRVEPGAEADVLVTYTANGQQFAGQLTISSNAENEPTLVVPVQARAADGAARLQFIHNAADVGDLGVTLDDEILRPANSDRRTFAYQTASPFVLAAAGAHVLTVFDANREAVATQALQFEAGRAYTVVATRAARTGGVRLTVTPDVRTASGDGDRVGALVINTLAEGRIDVRRRGGDVVTGLEPGARSEVTGINAGQATLTLAVGDATARTTFDLRSRGGQSVVILASGSTVPGDPMELIAFDADGQRVPTR
ncbi:DUF6519 domain-containing protein [Rubrivirga marina]|uniref:Uncharacterized protein n=1 Tax=Rubrivirga marina TaxID=1196024 RepID=A0A271IXT9_9BACT|nr:DUF6519 domain-containing protein [Rubrivirga marina]PAP76012.1 hypothetical protein BSZ37_05930 [Rubrivirga marina]